MKKKFEKQYEQVAMKVARMLSQNPTEDEALASLRALPRKDRRLVQRFVKKQEKTKNEKTGSNNSSQDSSIS